MLNLRQAHLIQSELFDEPDFHGEDSVRIQPGQMGENVTTSVIDLLALSKGTKLRFGEEKNTQAEFESRNTRAFDRCLSLRSKYLVVSLLLEVVFVAIGYGTSWYGIATAISDSAHESPSVFMVFGAVLASLSVDSNLLSIVWETIITADLVLLK